MRWTKKAMRRAVGALLAEAKPLPDLGPLPNQEPIEAAAGLVALFSLSTRWPTHSASGVYWWNPIDGTTKQGLLVAAPGPNRRHRMGPAEPIEWDVQETVRSVIVHGPKELLWVVPCAAGPGDRVVLTRSGVVTVEFDPPWRYYQTESDPGA